MAANVQDILASLLLPEDSDWQVESFEQNEANGSIYVHVRFSKPEVTVAGKKFPIYDFRPARTWRHLDLWQCQTYITARIPRYRVDGKILSLEVPWADAGERLTSMLEKKTIDTLLETKSQTATARLLLLTFDQVHHVMERAVEFGLMHRSKTKSHNHIHIDEKSVHGRDFASILYDDDGTVLEVVGGRKKADTKALINKALNPIQQANVLTASIDMWDPFRDAIRELMPYAAICHDPFHIVKHLNGAVDNVRRREVKTQQELKRKRYLFLKDTAGFTAKQQMEFDAIVKANYETSRAWRIKEDLP